MCPVRRLVSLTLLVTFVAVGLGPPIGSLAAQSNGQVRVVHALPGIPTVDVLVDGMPVLVGLPFGRDAGYLIMPAGAHTVDVVPTGIILPAGPLGTELMVRPGEAYTIIAAEPSLRPLVLADESLAPTGGPPLVRLAHTSPNTPPLDLAVAGGLVVSRNIAFGEASPYLDAPAGPQDLLVSLAGTDTIVASVPDATLAPDRVYTFAAIGLSGGTPPLSVLPLIDPSPPMIFMRGPQPARSYFTRR